MLVHVLNGKGVWQVDIFTQKIATLVQNVLNDSPAQAMLEASDEMQVIED